MFENQIFISLPVMQHQPENAIMRKKEQRWRRGGEEERRERESTDEGKIYSFLTPSNYENCSTPLESFPLMFLVFLLKQFCGLAQEQNRSFQEIDLGKR